MSNPIIAPSLLSADFSRLAEAVAMINQSKAQWLHLDIMDGHFVPNITFGPPVIRDIKKHTNKLIDVHLMIEQPDRYLEAFHQAGADLLTVHYETCPHLHRTIHRIKELGMQAGVAINPHNPISLLEDIVDYADLILVMSVNPGFGGQQFIEASYKRLRQAKYLIESSFSSCRLEVDGGVSLQNAGKLVTAGADVLVAGNAVFSSPEPIGTIEKLWETAAQARNQNV